MQCGAPPGIRQGGAGGAGGAASSSNSTAAGTSSQAQRSSQNSGADGSSRGRSSAVKWAVPLAIGVAAVAIVGAQPIHCGLLVMLPFSLG